MIKGSARTYSWRYLV